MSKTKEETENFVGDKTELIAFAKSEFTMTGFELLKVASTITMSNIEVLGLIELSTISEGFMIDLVQLQCEVGIPELMDLVVNDR